MTQSQSPPGELQAEKIIRELFEGQLLISHAKLAEALQVGPETLYEFGNDGAIQWRGKPNRRRYAEIDVRSFLLDKDGIWQSSKSSKSVKRPVKKSSTPRSGTTASGKNRPATRRGGKIVSFKDRLDAAQKEQQKPSNAA